LKHFDFVIVGAGFAGSVCAQQLAEAGASVLVLEKRPHIAGNAYDCLDAAGVLIHPYGPHIFHTNSERVFQYLSRFTEWRDYEHRVLAMVNGRGYPIPINRRTINELYGWNLSGEEVAAHLESVRVPIGEVRTSEDVVLGSVGHDLCEKFFRGYTRKQWGLDLSELSAGVAARIPTRTNDDDRYFTDKFQCMPREGYTRMFERMLEHPRIEVRLRTAWDPRLPGASGSHLVYTGPIDAYFGYRLGRLPYRSLRFEHTHLPDREAFQSTGTVNYPNDDAFTRITEFKYLTGQSHGGTSIVREFPTDTGEPFYPIPTRQNEALFKQYQALASEAEGTTFLGRLAEYRYYNMDQVVGAALASASSLRERLA
jgi:UDP-galactopyranose mutase